LAFKDTGAYDLWTTAACLSLVSMNTEDTGAEEGKLFTAPIDNRIAVFESFAEALYYVGTDKIKNEGASSEAPVDQAVSGYDKDFVLGALGQRSDNTDTDGNWCAPKFKVESTDLADDVTLKADTGFNHKTKCTW